VLWEVVRIFFLLTRRAVLESSPWHQNENPEQGFFYFGTGLVVKNILTVTPSVASASESRRGQRGVYPAPNRESSLSARSETKEDPRH